MTFTVTSPAIRPMMVITTSISISVTPRSDFLRVVVIWLFSNSDIVDARDSQHQAHNQAPYHQAHHQDDERLKQRRETPDGGSRFAVVNIGHAVEHGVQMSGFFAHHQKVSGQRRKLSRPSQGSGDAFTALH